MSSLLVSGRPWHVSRMSPPTTICCPSTIPIRSPPRSPSRPPIESPTTFLTRKPPACGTLSASAIGPDTSMRSSPYQRRLRSTRSFRTVFDVTTKPSPFAAPGLGDVVAHDADQITRAREHGATGVAGVDDRVGLKELGEREVPGHGVGLPPRADYSLAERVAEPVGRAHDEHGIAHANGIRIGELGHGGIRGDGRYLDDGDVGPRLGGDDPRLVRFLSEELDHDLVHRVDDVGGRGDLTVGRDQDAGADLPEADHAGRLDLLATRSDHDHGRIDAAIGL